MKLLALALALAPASGEDPAAAPVAAPAGPQLEVLEGRVRVFAVESWMELTRGARLPETRARQVLQLDWNARVRMVVAGAGVELSGPLEVESTWGAPWRLAVAGGGDVRVDARWTPIELELASAAKLDVRRGTYWAESASGGGWRAGCDAGEPLALRAPSGAHWGAGLSIEAGRQVRIVAASAPPPPGAADGIRVAAAAWHGFTWPWAVPAGE